MKFVTHNFLTYLVVDDRLYVDDGKYFVLRICVIGVVSRRTREAF